MDSVKPRNISSNIFITCWTPQGVGGGREGGRHTDGTARHFHFISPIKDCKLHILVSLRVLWIKIAAFKAMVRVAHEEILHFILNTRFEC